MNSSRPGFWLVALAVLASLPAHSQGCSELHSVHVAATDEADFNGGDGLILDNDGSAEDGSWLLAIDVRPTRKDEAPIYRDGRVSLALAGPTSIEGEPGPKNLVRLEVSIELVSGSFPLMSTRLELGQVQRVTVEAIQGAAWVYGNLYVRMSAPPDSAIVPVAEEQARGRLLPPGGDAIVGNAGFAGGLGPIVYSSEYQRVRLRGGPSVDDADAGIDCLRAGG